MNTPLFNALVSFAELKPQRLHMPGHKGLLSGPFEALSPLDVTELLPTGNLYTGEGPITPAEDLCAAAAEAADALFFSCGSTQGIFTMLAAAVGMGGTLVLDRQSHKSVYHGMGLLDITPRYLNAPVLPERVLAGPITPELLETALTKTPEARAVLVTSPSYYGIRADIAGLSAVCHRHGALLLVDEAHGAHFPFVGLSSVAALGADLAVASTHKTWPALGSSAILYRNEHCPISKAELKDRSAIFATTSPSFPILASIDYARGLLEGSYGDKYKKTAHLTAELRKHINTQTRFHALTPEDGLLLDPCRLTIDTRIGGLSGFGAEQQLRAQNIYMEMADERYIVGILTCCDEAETFAKLLSALKMLTPDRTSIPAEPLPSLPEIKVRCSIRQALFGPREYLPLRSAAGRISGEIVAPYPPGIPILAPGEEITEKHIAYLQKKSYNIDESIAAIPQENQEGFL